MKDPTKMCSSVCVRAGWDSSTKIAGANYYQRILNVANWNCLKGYNWQNRINSSSSSLATIFSGKHTNLKKKKNKRTNLAPEWEK